MKKDTLVFMGRSGSGKGTQIKLLKEFITTRYPDTALLHFETGDRFRKLMAEGSYTSDIIRSFVEQGKLVPDFITEWMLTDFMVHNFKGNQFLIFDGFPRTLQQAETMDALMNYYDIKNVKIIDVDVSGSEVLKRMLLRGREDDNEELIKERIHWYDEHVLPAIQYFKEKDNYEYIHIDGEQSIDDVFAEIIKKLNY